MMKQASISRRNFIGKTAYFGAACAAVQWMPLPRLAAEAPANSQTGQTPVVDKGFASVRKIGEGLYATISDPSKGLQTMCNGGFLVGKQSALLLEGFVSPAGAQFQLDVLKSVSQSPIKCALDTHYHYDHSTGNSAYGANGIALWAHAQVAKRIVNSYGAMQGVDKSVALATQEKALRDATTDVAREHRRASLQAVTNVYNAVNASLLTLPNHPIDPLKLPMKVDLGGLTAVIETHPGHTGTDLIVRVPEQNVVYTGDLLFNGIFPVCFDPGASVSGWRETLKIFASYDKDTIFVPGHGQLCGQETVGRFRDMFDDIDAQARKMFNDGVPVGEALDRYVIPEKFKGVSVFAWDFSIGPTIEKLYGEWGAK